MSSRAIGRPCRSHATASCAASVVFPAPPLRCAIVITSPAIDPALAEVDGRGHLEVSGLTIIRRYQQVSVTPAQAGIQGNRTNLRGPGFPLFAGMTSNLPIF